MYKEISIQQYLEKAQKVQIIDVRSPKEFKHAHIPGAINMPLFDDAERAIVGTAYKQEGREIAILKGLEIVGPKMAPMVAEIKEKFSGKPIVLHCWRGGMRSKSVATLLSFCGIDTEVIKGGYKSYRKEVQNLFLQNMEYIILGGRTGSAKTKILSALKTSGEQVIDLEKLANHKGSAFGDLGEDVQPTTEIYCLRGCAFLKWIKEYGSRTKVILSVQFLFPKPYGNKCEQLLLFIAIFLWKKELNF